MCIVLQNLWLSCKPMNVGNHCIEWKCWLTCMLTKYTFNLGSRQILVKILQDTIATWVHEHWVQFNAPTDTWKMVVIISTVPPAPLSDCSGIGFQWRGVIQIFCDNEYWQLWCWYLNNVHTTSVLSFLSMCTYHY